jgi:glycosyltransferase involved in cell wall biosynthesis
MSGLFVQKHAEAVRAQGCDVRVIFAQTWRETIRQWKDLRREGWMPEVVQLNVLQKQGALALWLKRRYHIPYLIVEHWSGYLPENGQFMRMSAFKRKLYERIAAEAETVLTVSEPLQRAMQRCGLKAKKWGTVDNVVDEFFESTDRCADRTQNTDRFTQKTLLHVSCFDERAKNVKGLLRAAKMLSEKRQDWRLVLIGTGVDYKEVRAYAKALEIPEDLLHWTGELSPQEVAERMHQADALVLSSRYETYGVVLAEAFVAGLPILSTPVGIAEEVADLIVPQEIAQHKPGKFAEFLESILWNTEHRTQSTDRFTGKAQNTDRCADRAQSTDRFTKEAIGKQLKEIYDSCLHRDI